MLVVGFLVVAAFGVFVFQWGAHVKKTKTPMRTGVLDPLGAGLEPGPGLYREMMRRMARSLLECLGANS